MMYSKILLLCLSLFTVTALANHVQFSDEEKAYIKEKSEIFMCIDPDWMPYEKIENGHHIGMTRDYMELFSGKIGIPITLVPTTSWLQSLEYAKARRCDIFSLAMSTPERSEYMNFTQPYLRVPLVIATQINEIFIADIRNVSSRKLAIVEGYAYAELLKLKYPKINLVEVPAIHAGLDKVANGEVFGFIGTLSSVGYAIQHDYIGELKVAGKFDETWELGVGIRNDDAILFAIFSKVINSLDHNKQQEIMNKWITVKYDKGFNYELIWKIFAVISVLSLFFIYRHFELIKYNRLLEKLSVTDKLTGLYNRLKIDEKIKQQIDLYQRYKTPFSIMLLDLDHFKSINDKFGHQIGDKVLVLFSSILNSNLRKTDIIGRWGGEEFIAILPETSLNGAIELAEKIRLTIQNDGKHHRYGATVSIGVVEVQENENSSTIIKRADDALYQAKANGRNCVETL